MTLCYRNKLDKGSATTVTLANRTRDQLKDYSMIELAILILEKNKNALNYKDIFEEIADMKDLPEDERVDYLAQFYTDLNLDGRFLTLGSGDWGLKKWYSVEQIDEIIKTEATPERRKKRKKKKKKKKVEEDDEPSIDDLDDDVTEIPLEIVERAHLSKAEDEDDDTLTLSDDNLIDEEDLDDYDEDEDEEDDDLFDDEEDEDEEDEDER